MASLVEELQRDALDWSIPVIQLLQRCRVIAAKLEVKELADWVRLELNGYYGSDVEIPEYRKAGGIPQVWNPYHGFQPLTMDDEEMQGMISSMTFSHPISEIEHIVSQNPEGHHFTYSPHQAAILRRVFQLGGLQPSMFVSTSQIKRVVEAVRGELVEWSLRLETAGIKGQGMDFSREEKVKAQHMVTYNVAGHYIHGDVQQSQVGTQHSVQHNVSHQLDIEAVQKIVQTLTSNMSQLSLPSESVAELKAEVQTLRAQLESPRPKASIVKESLKSVRTILESVATTALSKGLAYEIGKILPS